MEAETIAVYYGMFVDRSLKILSYVRIVAAHSHPTTAQCPVT